MTTEENLNSRLLDFWYEYRGKRKGSNREYVETPIESIPIRRIDFDNAEDVASHDYIVQSVVAMREKMSELAAYSKYFKGTSLTRLMMHDPVPELHYEAVVQSLPPEERFSLRTHPQITIIHGTESEDASFILGKVGEVSLTLEGPKLEFQGKDRRTMLLIGEKSLLEFVARIARDYHGRSWASIKEEPFIPVDVAKFTKNAERILHNVSQIRATVRSLKDSIDRTVNRLYGFTDSETM